MCAEGVCWHDRQRVIGPGRATEREWRTIVEEDLVRLIVLAGLMVFVIRAVIAGLREPDPEK
jgi:hypothetical protein